MARPLRLELAGAWYHILARGNERKAIFRQPGDRLYFLTLLAESVERFRRIIHSYVLMDNHFHLLVETPEPNLSRGMQWFNVSYSVWFNRRHHRSGHLFRGRFKGFVVEPQEWALILSRYLHLNPVRIGRLGLGKADREASRLGLSKAPERAQVRERVKILRDYRWSSCRAYTRLEAAPEWLCCSKILELAGGGSHRKQQEAYQSYAGGTSARRNDPEPLGSIAGAIGFRDG